SYFDEMMHQRDGAGEIAYQRIGRNGHQAGHAGTNGSGSVSGNGSGAAVRQIGPSFRPASLFAPPRIATGDGAALAPLQASASPAEQWHMAVLQDRVDQLIRSFRVRGHLVAQIDPLGFPRPELQELDPDFYGLT